MQFKDVFRL